MLLWSGFWMLPFYSKNPCNTHLGLLGEPALERLGALRLRHEADEPLSFLDQGVAVLFGQSLEQLDHEHRLPASSLRPPRSADEAVDEYGGWNHAVLGGDYLAVVVGDDAGAISMGQDQVIELGQEAWRGRSVRAGPRRVGQVEQFLAVLVAEGAQARPEPLGYLGEPGQARPGLYVRDGGRSERPEVAHDHLV